MLPMNYNAVEMARQQRQDYVRDAQREQLAQRLTPQPSLYRVAMLTVAAMLISVGRRLQARALDAGPAVGDLSLNSGMTG